MKHAIFAFSCLIGGSTMAAGESSGPVIERLNPGIDQLVAPDAEIELIAEGFGWSEGPVWDLQNQRLLFSSIRTNTIHAWSDGKTTVYLQPGGFTGEGDPGHANIGPNGLALDGEGRLIICRHGDRNVVRQEHDGSITVLAERWKGKRLNSPNDVAVHPSSDIYFTDPPFGLKDRGQDGSREIDVLGVYRIPAGDGAVEMVVDDLNPNGIAFAPGGETVYLTHGRRLMRFVRRPDGSLGEPTLFYEMTEPGGFDGLTVDAHGNVYACNWRGGVLILAADGTHLGTIRTGFPTANCTIGGEDGKTLFITSDARLFRLPLKVGAD